MCIYIYIYIYILIICIHIYIYIYIYIRAFDPKASGASERPFQLLAHPKLIIIHIICIIITIIYYYYDNLYCILFTYNIHVCAV